MSRKILGFIVWLIYRTLSATWKVSLVEPESFQNDRKNKKPFILAHWHGDELVLFQLISRYRLATISSQSKDGEMMSAMIHLQGGATSRGSSSRGAIQALKGLVRLVKSGRICSFAVDGPKGPIHIVKPGVFEISRLLNLPIYVAGVSADKVWRSEKAWNKAFLPKPFAKVSIVWQGPIGPIQENEDPRSEQLAQQLADALRKAGETSLKKIAAPSA